ncbi:MAG: M81 family metallopeptidase [Pseudomonadota bacterium]
MKVLIAGLATETNTFSPIPTGLRSFEESMSTRTATKEPPNLFSAPLHEWRKAGEDRGWDVIESRAAFAQPAGLTIRSVYEAFRDEIIADIIEAKPDIILVSMHGAMVAEGYDDCEGDLTSSARDAAPDAVIGLELDPHHHLTEAMLSACDLIIAYKEYPHTDGAERARELFALAANTAEGKIKPVMRDYDCRMMAMYHTPKQPVRAFVDAMLEREGRDGILSLSLTHGFPWGDVARVGTRMLAIANGSSQLAEDTARAFGEKLWSLREEIHLKLPTISEALDHVQAQRAGPIVLADFADNAGGGAPSDSTFFLREVLDRGMKDVALGIYWDPGVLRSAQEIGVGGKAKVRLGGKVAPMSGDPIDLEVTVRALGTDMRQALGDSTMPMGDAAWLDADGVHLVVNDMRTQCFNPSAFTDLGVDLAAMRAVIVKSSQHFYVGFEPVASEIIHVATPGAIPPDFASIPYTKRSGSYWPRIEDPFRPLPS